MKLLLLFLLTFSFQSIAQDKVIFKIFGTEDDTFHVRVSKASNGWMKFEECDSEENSCRFIGQEYYSPRELKNLTTKAYLDIPRAVVIDVAAFVALVKIGLESGIVLSASWIPLVDGIVYGLATGTIGTGILTMVVDIMNPFEQWRQAKALEINESTNDVILGSSIDVFITDLTIALTRRS